MSTYIEINKLCTYIKILALLITIKDNKTMLTHIQIVSLTTYTSSSLLLFRPFLAFPIMNIYIRQ
jgi:hypothetical protein